MAGYPRKRESMYTNVTGLNALPEHFDMGLQQPHQLLQNQPGYDFQSDLDMFTNTQFYDLDMGEVPENNSPNSHDGDQWTAAGTFLPADRRINNFQTYPSGTSNAALYNGYSEPSSSSNTPPVALNAVDGVEVDSKGSADGLQTMEEASRMAAEEDKRRRNTAASARFRVKKKQREQALEKTAKDMTDRVTYLENRVATLELENKLLKDLITEKSGAGAGIDMDLLMRQRAESKKKNEALAAVEERRRREMKINPVAKAGDVTDIAAR